MLSSWFYLILAVLTEVAGTLAMNASGETQVWWMYLVMYLFISTSYILLSHALKKIPVAIALAIWEGLGVLIITAISYFTLHEPLTQLQLLGIFLAIIGILLLNFGEEEHHG